MNIVAEIKKHLELTPFRPFSVRTGDGHEYLVPAEDHIYISPGATGVIIADDKGVTVMVPGRLVSGLVRNAVEDENGAPAS